jgi:hypothetical protein
LKPHKAINLPEDSDAMQWQASVRPTTVEAYVASVEQSQNAPPVASRLHPESTKLPFPFRFAQNPNQHTVVVHEAPGEAPQVMQHQNGVLTQVDQNKFQTPRRTGLYAPVNNRVDIETPGGHKTSLLLLEKNQVSGNKRKIDFDDSVEHHEVTVELSYKHLMNPVKGKRINNRQAHGGESADDKIASVDKKRTKVHHEWTHEIAGHWGVIKEQGTGEKRDPAAASSTFVAPAAFNTEMILAERYAGHLQFSNHHHNGVAKTKPSVEYTMSYQQDPHTFHIPEAEVKVKDLVTGIEATQHWDLPSSLSRKPDPNVFVERLADIKSAAKRELIENLVPVPVEKPLLFSSSGAQYGKDAKVERKKRNSTSLA